MNIIIIIIIVIITVIIIVIIIIIIIVIIIIIIITLLLPASLHLLKTCFYSRGFCTGSASEWTLLWMTLYKFSNTIQ